MAVTEAPEKPQADERVRRAGLLRRLLSRPELGAVAGAIVVWVFFSLVAGNRGFFTIDGTASYLEVASELGILAVAVCLLMIAGEFDLSIGSIIGASGMVIALLNVEYGWPLWAAILMAIAFSLVAGFLNGLVVVWTKLPSFIVTLASLFIFRGLTIGITRLVTGRTQIGGIDVDEAPLVKTLFTSQIGPFSISIVWWLALAALATWVLLRTRVGNWIFGAGGAPDASRNLGVPVDRLKIGLFMTTAFAACLVAILQVTKFTGADVLRGTGQEFVAIIAVVIGGTLLTGGYGSAIGAVFGALIFGMVRQGIVITGVNADWFQVFLGAMLIIAVLINNYIRRKAAEAKR
ncbi:MAG TPA: ABC transporter permease [Actinomycetota bacterium]|jgi:simple sugar transport system permease protein|nr:ABC transporter permease [Actinomycetota bacterium]